MLTGNKSLKSVALITGATVATFSSIAGITFCTKSVAAQSIGNVYNITIQGTVAQDVRLGVYRNFQGVGQVVSCPTITRTGVTNGVNPFDVALSFGNPYAGQTGAILFTTNSAFIPGSNSRLDLVSTSLNSQNGVLTIVPDSNLAGTSRNIFNATSGLTALPFAVYNGSMDVEFPNGGKSVVGKVDVLGFLGTNFYGRYVANFSGTLVSNIQCPNPS